jgi:hypothetical protein
MNRQPRPAAAACREDNSLRQLAFEKMLTYANREGVYAEQTSRVGQQQGNFPRH